MGHLAQNMALLCLCIMVNTACSPTLKNNVLKQEPPTLLAPISIFERLTGTWQLENGKDFERCSKNSDGTYRCYGFKIVGMDTSLNEQATIYRDASHWVFENTVKDQNEGKPVKFISTFLNESIVHFINPLHDFPTDIQYEMSDDNTLKTYISGPGKNIQKDTIYFYFNRVN